MITENENLLRAVRPVHLLIPRPGQAESDEPKFWAMRLKGLHHSHVNTSAKDIRKARKKPNPLNSDGPSLHLSSLRL